MSNVEFRRNLTKEQAEQFAFELKVEGGFEFEVKEEGGAWSVHYWSKADRPAVTAAPKAADAAKPAAGRSASATPAPPGGSEKGEGITAPTPPAETSKPKTISTAATGGSEPTPSTAGPSASAGPAPPRPASPSATAGPAPTATITTALLKAADSTNTDEYYDSIIEIINQYAEAYQINTPLRVAHFLSQIGHESKFKTVEENGNYSARRMREVFGCRGGMRNYNAAQDECTEGRLRAKLWTEESKYAGNAENLLSYVYSSRLGNGDEASGDGYNYRGRGMMQLTGKTNYSEFTASHNQKNPGDPRDFVANPDLLVTDRQYGIESAFYFWDARNINAIADSDNVRDVTTAVNGGLNGLPDREARLRRIKQALGI